MSIVDELVTILGIDIDPAAQSTAYKFGFILGEVGKGAVALGAALSVAAGAITAYAVHTADAIDKEQELAATLGVSYEAYQKLAYAAKLSGGDIETLNAGLGALQKTLLNPATGDENKALAALGISARDASGHLKTADVIVQDLAGKFENLSAAEQFSYSRLLRLSPAMVRLLQNGQKGLAEMGAEAEDLGLILDDKAAKAAAEFGDSLDRLRAVSEGLGRRITLGLIPGLHGIVEGVTDWVKANRRLIASGITQIVEGVGKGFRMVGTALSAVWDTMKQLLPVIDDLTEGLDATQAIGIAVALAIGAAGIAAAIAAAPFVLLAATIAAVVLVIEDLYELFTGGESAIGAWIGQFQEAFPIISSIMAGIVSAIGTVISVVTDGLVGAFNAAFETAKAVFGGIASLIGGVVSGVEKTINVVKSLGSPESLATMSQAVMAGSLVPIPAGIQAGAAAGGGDTTVSPTIIVNGAGDPAAVGQEVVQKAGLGQTLQQSRPGARGPSVG